jgi:hypothetical protein
MELIQHEESFSSFYKFSSNVKQNFYSMNIIDLQVLVTASLTLSKIG